MHTNPEVLALVALGEQVATQAEHDHILTCPACSEEVAELARIADVGRSSAMPESMSAPSPQVWERIQAELGFRVSGSVVDATGRARPGSAPPGAEPSAATVTELAPRRDASAASGPPRRTSAARRFLALAVAAALALIVGIGIGIGYEQRVTRPEDRVIASAQLAPLPAWDGASGTAEVTADGHGGRKLIVKMSSPKPVTGKVQVWLMDAKGTPTSMGVMSNGVATLDVPPGMSLFERPLVDISDEPADDTDPGHNGDSILRGKLV
jgi:anti-sigma-K factor RskA